MKSKMISAIMVVKYYREILHCHDLKQSVEYVLIDPGFRSTSARVH